MRQALMLGVLAAAAGAAAVGPWAVKAAGAVASKPTSEPAGNAHAKPRLITDLNKVTPGGEILLGLTLDIDPEWYTYWPGQNDSGTPINFKLTVPEGFTASEIRWPAPDRYVLPGDLVDYVYRTQVTLVIPVRVPRDVTGEVEFAADVEFLVCKEACLPGAAKLSVKVPVAKPGEVAQPTADATRFETARKTWPCSRLQASELELTWEGQTLNLRAPFAKVMTFMPHESGVTLVDPLAKGEVRANQIRLDFKPAEPAPGVEPAPGRVRGVLKRDNGKEGVDYVWIDEPLPKKSS